MITKKNQRKMVKTLRMCADSSSLELPAPSPCSARIFAVIVRKKMFDLDSFELLSSRIIRVTGTSIRSPMNMKTNPKNFKKQK